MKSNQRPKFTQPVLKKGDGKAGSWYVEFYYQVPDIGKMVRFRIKSATRFGGKKLPAGTVSTKIKNQYFSQLLNEVSSQLVAGWSPFSPVSQNQPTEASKELQEIVKQIKANRENRSDRTVTNYTAAANKFLKFIREKYPGIKTLDELNEQHAKGFLQTVSQRPASQNAFTRQLKAIFSSLIKSNTMKQNPFRQVAIIREIPTSNTPYTFQQAKHIMQVAASRHPLLLLAIAFEYYAFMRPAEIRMIQKKHLDTETMTITIPGKNSKGKRNDTIPMHHDLGILIGEKVQAMREDDWMFDNGQGYPVGEFYFSTAWGRIKKELDLKNGQTLYSFKHTGVIALYQATKDLHLVSRMCRHRDTATTEIYLRGLGQAVNRFDIQDIPSIT